ncbi:ArnT family glycosyltransferase [Celerinatantimonas yamalensis]|uniref:Glycosyltransferase family 39 protein n=1 Tax=Celerinatantimonas yamalensis TaxID=559956 RepID=A0ABW9G5R8_9GAMM
MLLNLNLVNEMDATDFCFRRFLSKSLWVIVFALAVHASNMSSADLRGDAIVYASIAKNILTLHSPLILHFDGATYLNKPPLFFWLTALSLSVFGYTIFAVKFVAVLTAILLNVALFYLFVRIARSYNLGYLAIFCVNTTYVIYKNAHDVRMESLSALLITVSLCFLWHYLRSAKCWHLLLFGLMSGLAVMTKGFLGLLPWAVWLLYLCLPLARELRTKRLFWHSIAAFGLFLATFLWWYVYISLHTNFFHHFFYDEVIARLFDGGLQAQESVHYHSKPVYQYLLYMCRDYFLYLPFFIFGCYKCYQNSHQFDRNGLTLIAIFTLLSWLAIQVISTRAERYLFTFYTTAAFFCAFGIASIPQLKRVQFVNWLKVLGISYIIFILVAPMKLSWNSYRSLRDLKQLSYNANIPIAIENRLLPDYGDRAGVEFFLGNEFVNAPPQGRYFTVLPKSYQGDLNYLLIKRTRQLLIVLVEPSTFKVMSQSE